MMFLRRFLLIAMSLLLTLFIAACSIPGVGSTSNSGSSISGTSSSTTGSKTGSESGQPTTEQLNLQFTYASVNYTITSVQEATSFADDTSRYDPGQHVILRVNFKETNPTSAGQPYATGAAGSFYQQVVHLLLPDGSAIDANTSRFDQPVNPQTSRINWLDFAVTGPILDLSKLGLQMGAASEAQMNIPLAPSANLSQYQPKTITLNTTLQYSGLTYTITSATKSLSAHTHQAATGQVFITLTLKVTNPSSNNFGGFASDYMRLQSVSATNPPIYSIPDNFLSGVSAQSSGTGTVTFSMPQESTSFTLILLAYTGVSQATTTFQLA